ncbi:MAG: hypothetical protein JXI43_04695 [Tissierellales bacterium]|nr:hypothetical protein [Tissierellales bacterium]
MNSNIDKEQRALDALMSVALTHLNDTDRIGQEIERLMLSKESEIVLSKDDEKALAKLGDSIFKTSNQESTKSSNSIDDISESVLAEEIFAMGRNGDLGDVSEETKKEIEKRRKEIQERLTKKRGEQEENDG